MAPLWRTPSSAWARHPLRWSPHPFRLCSSQGVLSSCSTAGHDCLWVMQSDSVIASEAHGGTVCLGCHAGSLQQQNNQCMPQLGSQLPACVAHAEVCACMQLDKVERQMAEQLQASQSRRSRQHEAAQDAPAAEAEAEDDDDAEPEKEGTGGVAKAEESKSKSPGRKREKDVLTMQVDDLEAAPGPAPADIR